jgi:Arc/MetJ-type ribon-helix-helix transcriptional regulator
MLVGSPTLRPPRFPSSSSALETGVKGNKWFSLIDKASRLDVLELAWEQVKSNAGACGGSPARQPPRFPSAASVDGITVEAFAKDSQKRLLAVSEQIKRGAYQPQPVKRVWIPKPGSAEKRPLGIPTVRDRGSPALQPPRFPSASSVVQSALRMVIEPIFEREFAEQSYGFRPGRSCRDALRRVDELLKSGHWQGSPARQPPRFPSASSVVQTALRMVIEPIFEREFAEQSYGFRPGRSCRDALRRVDELLQSGHWQGSPARQPPRFPSAASVVDIDIRGLPAFC